MIKIFIAFSMLLALLKLTGSIDIGWIWVVLPAVVPLVFSLAVMAFGAVCLFFGLRK